MTTNQIPDWAAIKPVKVNEEPSIDENNNVCVPTDNGPLTISFYKDAVRLRIGRKRPDNQYGILVSVPDPSTPVMLNEKGRTTINSGSLTFIVEHNPFSFEFYKDDQRVQRSAADGHFERRFRVPPLAKVAEGWMINLNLESNEPVYGLGEKWGKLDKRGQFIRSYNCDALGVNSEVSYKNTPFAWSNSGWGTLAHTPAPVTHSVGHAPWSQRSYTVIVEDDAFDFFLFAAENGKEIIRQYANLSGFAPRPPLWSLGVILSKAYYLTQEELLSTADEARKRGMPCDVITIDGRAWQDTDTRFLFEWDPRRYPDPAKVMDELKSKNFKVCVWEYPLVSVKNGRFQELSDKGYFLKDKRTGKTFEYEWDSQAFGDVLSPLPKSGIIDFTNPGAYAFWRECHKEMCELGVDMIKADFGEQVEYDDMLAFNGETGHALHNVYALLYNRCVYEAAEKYAANGPFLFSRSAWTGSQRYPAQWGGDPQANWGGMAGNIRGGVSWGMSGAPYYATDIGGFYQDERDLKLYVRWLQAGVFSAHMRLHGIGPREPWSYGPEVEQVAFKALDLRYQLIPYLWETMQQSHETGLPVQRAMALDYPDERVAWAFEDQYMFGDDILVAPCLRPDGFVEVYLPAGNWHNFQTGEKFVGGKSYKFTLALEDMAVFVKAGAKIPLGPKVKHTDALQDKIVVEKYWAPEQGL